MKKDLEMKEQLCPWLLVISNGLLFSRTCSKKYGGWEITYWGPGFVDLEMEGICISNMVEEAETKSRGGWDGEARSDSPVPSLRSTPFPAIQFFWFEFAIYFRWSLEPAWKADGLFWEKGRSSHDPSEELFLVGAEREKGQPSMLGMGPADLCEAVENSG